MFYRIAAGISALMLAAFLIWVYGNSRENAGELQERIKWQSATAAQTRKIADLELQLSKQVIEAQASHIERTIRMEPVIVRSTNTIREIRTNPVFAVQCLDPERVRRIEEDAAALFPTASQPAISSADPMQENTHGNQR